MVLSLLALSVLFASSTSAAPLDQNTNLPIQIRECFTTPLPPSLIPPLATYLTTLPPITLAPGMTRHTITFSPPNSPSPTCLQADLYNWSCDTAISVTGPGLANTIRGIGEQCARKDLGNGEVAGAGGWGYYRDLETGTDYTRHLWVLLRECGGGPVRSACSPGA